MRTFIVFTVALIAALAKANPVEDGNQPAGIETAQQSKEEVINAITQATNVALAAFQRGELTKAQFHEVVEKLKAKLEEELGLDRNLPQQVLENVPESVKNNARKEALQAFQDGQISLEQLKGVLQALAPAGRPA